MKKNIFIAAIIAVLAISTFAFINYGTDTKSTIVGYGIGDEVKDFSLKNIDGKLISMASKADAKGLILVITCNHCPYAKAYQSRVISLDKKFAPKGYPVIAINANVTEDGSNEDTIEENKKEATEKGFSFEYLKDETQEVAKALGANRTPTVYVVQKEGSKYILKYMGGIDDNAQSPQNVTKSYVDQAVTALLESKSVATTTTKTIGCGIKWKNE